jgi:hypothetical protein
MSGALALASGAASLLGVDASWLRRLRVASFRGVPFHFDRVGHSYGRRYAMHQYPGRDQPWAEPLGRAQRTWTISAYHIGDDFPSARERLRQACEDNAEPGSLILPIVGRVEAVCTDFSFDDTRIVGRHSAISLTFAESGTRQFPVGIEDTWSLIGAAANAFGDAERGTFLGTGSQAGFYVGSPSNLPISLSSDARSFSFAATTLASAATVNVLGFADSLDALRLPSHDYEQAPLVAAIALLREQAQHLVYDAPRLFDAVDAAFGAYTDAMPAENVFLGMLALASTYEAQQAPLVLSQLPSSSELRAAETRNALLFQGLVRRLALRETGFAMPGIDLDNTERAETIRDQIFAAFVAESDLAADAGDDPAFAAMTELAHRLLDDLDHRAAQLPSLAPYRTGRSLNAITLAYRLYADAGRNLDLVERVGAFTPAFMPIAGRVLDR